MSSYSGTECIYRLRDPRNKSVRYIGQTNNFEKRIAAHFADTAISGEKQAWTRELRSLGLRPEANIIEDCTGKARIAIDRAERYWIYTCLEQGERLFNNFSVLGKDWERIAMREHLLRTHPEMREEGTNNAFYQSPPTI